MNPFKRLQEKYKQRIAFRDQQCQDLLNMVNRAISNMDSFLNSSDFSLDVQQGEKIYSENSTLLYTIKAININKFKRAPAYLALNYNFELLKIKHTGFLNSVRKQNDNIARKRMAEAYRLLGNVEGRRLDEQQMICILKEAHNHLVIAGAGTGKTTTIVGKIKYLLKTSNCRPEKILVLSFTNASANEMKERIREETGYPIEASTFHKLGRNIISECNGVAPKITGIDLYKFIKEKLSVYMKQPEYQNLLATYLLYHGIPVKSEFDFSDENEYNEFLEANPPITLKNERVKSYGELDIANFLAQNGIQYQYEMEYPVDTRTSKYAQYYPDFFLPEYDLYIEYFGINRQGEVPSYFRSTHGKSASQEYRESMEWKRQLHREYGSVMIECFAYDKFEGELLSVLEKQLKEHGVSFEPVPAQALLDELSAGGDSLIDGFIKLAETVIKHIKSNRIDASQLRGMIQTNMNYTASEHTILSLIEPLLKAYNEALAVNDEIDFIDMINIATQYVSDGKYRHDYSYVIIDEYQDISKGRFALIKAMRDQKDFDLFCVGDDWQSIYRFTGSDIGFILNFGRYWGAAEISKIETTYRFSQQLVDISGRFIMQNPSQVRKNIRGNLTVNSFPLGEICGYTETNLVDFLVVRLIELPENCSVFFIGRYDFDINYIKDSPDFTCKYDNAGGKTVVVFARRKDLQIEFLTAHRSKGLQADYVFILNNMRSYMGFPSKMQDAPILRLFLDNCDNYQYAEERRLFYVALTRAKVKVILLTLAGKESEFVAEMRSAYAPEMKTEAFACPRCGGRLIKQNGIYGEFFGCSNYRTKGCEFKRNIRGRG